MSHANTSRVLHNYEGTSTRETAAAPPPVHAGHHLYPAVPDPLSVDPAPAAKEAFVSEAPNLKQGALAAAALRGVPFDDPAPAPAATKTPAPAPVAVEASPASLPAAAPYRPSSIPSPATGVQLLEAHSGEADEVAAPAGAVEMSNCVAAVDAPPAPDAQMVEMVEVS